MRLSFSRLDDALIERLFQPVSDAISHGIGLPRAAVTCWCLDAAALAWIISRARGVSDAVVDWNAVDSFTGVVMMLLGLVALLSLRTLFRRTSGQKANPLRLTMRPHRVVLLLLLLTRLTQLHTLDIADLADLATLTLAGVAMYLGACAERPPVRRGAPSAVFAAG